MKFYNLCLSVDVVSADGFAGSNQVEDLVGTGIENPFFNEYWDDKMAQPSAITVPTYTVASWTSPVHTVGTLRAYGDIPATTPKWLRVHNTQEWMDFYENQVDLRRFMDYYLKGKTDNGWDATPPVRLSILDYGNPAGDIIGRSENEWPLRRTEYVKYFLGPNRTMTRSQQSASHGPATVTYDGKAGRV